MIIRIQSSGLTRHEQGVKRSVQGLLLSLAHCDVPFVSQVTGDAMGWMVCASASEGGGETTARSRVGSAALTANVEDRRVGIASTDRARVLRASVVRRASLAPRACMASTAAWAARSRRAQVGF